MGPVSYFIAILGCADGGASCQTVATLASRYENAAQCAAARNSALENNSDLDFPTLIAHCQKSLARPAAAQIPVRPASNAKVA